MALTVDIRKDFGKFKLQVQFEACDGVTGLLGASGCGKSLTLKCIAGIETPDAGRIVLDGRVLFDSERRVNLSPQERRVGYLFQHYALFPNMTVLQNVMAGCRARTRSARQERAAALLRSLYLEDAVGKYPRQLSGGQQQRVALARILASDPEVLLLDEPFSALDSYLRWAVELELLELLERFGGTVLFVTHSRDEVHRLCRDVCVLSHGKSQPIQPVRELFRAPGTLSACLLSGCKNVSRASPRPDGTIDALDWGVTLDCGRPLPEGLTHIGVRAHFLRPGGQGQLNTLLCRTERVVQNVFSTIVMLHTPGGADGFSRLRLELPHEEWAALDAPVEFWIRIDPQDILLLCGS